MNRTTRTVAVIGVVSLAVLALYGLLHDPANRALMSTWTKMRGGYSAAERVEQYGPRVAARMQPVFNAAGVRYPPYEVAYLAFKDVRTLEVYARDTREEPWRFIKQYRVLGASGRLGPKLAEGDNQVPEGIYRAEYLNPNSRFHLSIRLNYPNEFDRMMAKQDGRTKLGGDIMIHGRSSSIGCLAMGDDAAEDLFVLSALVTKERTRIVVSPTDFRARVVPPLLEEPPWVKSLYEQLRLELQPYTREPAPLS